MKNKRDWGKIIEVAIVCFLLFSPVVVVGYHIIVNVGFDNLITASEVEFLKSMGMTILSVVIGLPSFFVVAYVVNCLKPSNLVKSELGCGFIALAVLGAILGLFSGSRKKL